jgi:hypothetical protein
MGVESAALVPVLRKYSNCALVSRLLADDSIVRLRCSNRIFVMQATKDRFHQDERSRRQAMAGFGLRGGPRFLRRIRYARTQRTMRAPAVVQVDNQTPIVPKRGKFSIRGTPGIRVWYG